MNIIKVTYNCIMIHALCRQAQISTKINNNYIQFMLNINFYFTCNVILSSLLMANKTTESNDEIQQVPTILYINNYVHHLSWHQTKHTHTQIISNAT